MYIVLCRSIVNSWDHLMRETEQTGHEHLAASAKIYEVADRLAAFIDKQKSQKKHVSKAVRFNIYRRNVTKLYSIRKDDHSV